jgi:hypothetical protein
MLAACGEKFGRWLIARKVVSRHGESPPHAPLGARREFLEVFHFWPVRNYARRLCGAARTAQAVHWSACRRPASPSPGLVGGKALFLDLGPKTPISISNI